MRSFDTQINYDGKSVVLHIDSANDREILRTAVGATIAMALKTDINLRKKYNISSSQQTEYDVIQAHGGNFVLEEQDRTLMTKDDAAKKYDIINVCNNELWRPGHEAKVKTYALGLINSREVKRHERLTFIDFKADFNGVPEGYPEQNPQGLHFIVDGVPYETINIGGTCYQAFDAQWNYDDGLDRLVMKDVYDFSKPK